MSDIMEAVREAGYQEGLKVGMARAEAHAEAIGFKIGVAKGKRKVALKMIADGYTDEKIQLYTDLSMDEINRLKKNSGNMEL